MTPCGWSTDWRQRTKRCGDLKPKNIFVTSDERIKVLDFGPANRGIQDIGGPITRPRLLGNQSVSSDKSFLDLSRRLQSEPLSFPAHRLNVLGILRIELLTQPIVLEELRPRIPTFTQALLARDHSVWVNHLSASTHFGPLEIHFDIIKLNGPHPLCDPPCESDATALPYLVSCLK
jgi:hypothetical protein